MILTAAMRSRFEREVGKYPAEHRQSAVMACLALVQAEHGHVSEEAQRAVADYLGMPPIAVHEVSTFYGMFNTRPVGAYKLALCTNLPCLLRGADVAWRQLQRQLNVVDDETTPDGLFTLRQSECLGACGDAPVLLVNDRSMCSFMTGERLDRLIDGLTRAEQDERQV